MKIFFGYLAAITAFALSAGAQVGPSAVKITKVETNIVKTPEYQFRGELKRFDLGEWMEIAVEFETTPEVFAELTFKYTVLIEGKLILIAHTSAVGDPQSVAGLSVIANHFGVWLPAFGDRNVGEILRTADCHDKEDESVIARLRIIRGHD